MTRYRKLLIVGVLCAPLAACATTGVTDRGVAAAERLLSATEDLAKNYTDLPRCGSVPAVGKPLCSDVAIVARMAEADNRAYNAVKMARENSALLDNAIVMITNFQNLIPRR